MEKQRLRVFRLITRDSSFSPPSSETSSVSSFSSAQLCPPYHPNSDRHSSDLSQTLNSSISSNISNYSEVQDRSRYEPEVAHRLLKSQIFQSIHQKFDVKTSKFPGFNRKSDSTGQVFSSTNLSTESSSREDTSERGKPKKRPLYENEKGFYVIRPEAIKAGKDTRTTVMIKNIPNKYSQKMLLLAIDKKFAGTYDFLYLPIDFKVRVMKNRCNVGYAFVNFLDYRVIFQVFFEFNGKRWEKFNSEKICEIAYGRIQGFDELVQHFENSSVIHQDDNKVKPVIMAGVRSK
jgi:hypothetical protein